MKSNALGIIAAVLGVSLALAFNSPSKKFQTVYALNTTGSETWHGKGSLAADQDPLHYSAVTPTYTCIKPPLDVVCTYTKSGTTILQEEQGHYVP